MKTMLNEVSKALPDLLIARIAIIAVLVPLAYFANRAFLFLLQRYLLHRKWVPQSFNASTYFSKSFFYLFLVMSAESLMPFLELPSDIAAFIRRLLHIALILMSAWVIKRIASFTKILIYLRLDITRVDNLRERKIRTQLQFIEKMVLLFCYFIAIALILMNFDSARKFGKSLIASAGLAGILLGFAAQKSLTNIIAGFQIAFTQPIRIDDVVIVENEWGRIEEITLTYVVIRIWDRRTLVVPISYFLEKPFQNWTRASADLLATVMLYVDYKMPLEPLRTHFNQVLKECPLWDGKVSAVQVTDINRQGLEVRFLFDARNASEAFDLRCIVREKLVGFIQQEYHDCFPQQRFRKVGMDGFEH